MKSGPDNCRVEGQSALFYLDNYFNFLQATHKEDPLPIEGPVGISHIYNNHLKDYASRFTNFVVQHIREVCHERTPRESGHAAREVEEVESS